MWLLRRAFLGGSNESRPVDTAAAGQHLWCIAIRGDVLYAGGADGHISIFQLGAAAAAAGGSGGGGASSRLIGELRGHEGTVYSLHARGNELFSGGGDGAIRAWRCSSPTALPLPVATAVASVPNLPVLALAGAPTGELFSGGADGMVRRWDLAEGSLQGSASTAAHSKTCFALALVPLDARAAAGEGAAGVVGVASVGSDAAVRVWHAATLELLVTVVCGTEPSAGAVPSVVLGAGASEAAGASGEAEAHLTCFCVAAAPPPRPGEPAVLLLGSTDKGVRLVHVPVDGRQPTSPLERGAALLQPGGVQSHQAFISAVAFLSAHRGLSAGECHPSATRVPSECHPSAI